MAEQQEPTVEVTEADSPSPVAARSLRELIERAEQQGMFEEPVHQPTALVSHVHRSNGRGPVVMRQRDFEQAMFELGQAHEAPLAERARTMVHEADDSEALQHVPLVVGRVGYLRPTRDFLVEVGRAFRSNQEIENVDDLDGLVRPSEYFGAAAMLPQRYIGFSEMPLRHDGQRVVFRVAEPIWHGVDEDRPERLVVDFDDGSGPRHCAWGDEIVVEYDSPGTKTLYIETGEAEGRRVATTLFDVGPALSVPNPDETWTLGTNGGKAWVWYAVGETTLTKPVVMCEGFPGGYSRDSLYDLYNQESLIDDVRQNGRAFVIVSFGNDALSGVFKCADTLILAINEANQKKTGTDKLVVGGGSMGGLVARCALLVMQDQGTDPDTEALLCFDSPNTGAYVPVSVQTFLRYFSSKYSDAKDKLDLLSSKSAKDMLVYFVEDGGGSLTSAERTAFVNQVSSLGNYPSNIQLIAVSDGRGDGVKQESGGSPLNLSLKWHLDIDPTVYVWLYNLPDPSNTDETISKMYNIQINFWSGKKWTVKNTYSYDGAPGGTSNVYPETKSALDGQCGADPVVSLDDNCFIPAVSAVGIGGDPYTPIQTANSPFDDVYIPPANEPHVKLTSAMKTFLMTFI